MSRDETGLQRVGQWLHRCSIAMLNFPATICFPASPQNPLLHACLEIIPWTYSYTSKKHSSILFCFFIRSASAALGLISKSALRKKTTSNGWCVFSNTSYHQTQTVLITQFLDMTLIKILTVRCDCFVEKNWIIIAYRYVIFILNSSYLSSVLGSVC